MGSYLLYTTPALGHLYPSLGVALELSRRGHRVAVRTLASQLDLVRGLGLAAAPIDPAIEGLEHDDWKCKNPIDALGSAVTVFLRRAQHEIGDLRRAIADEKPDVLFVDINAWGAGAVAEASGLPWAYFAPYFLPIRSRDAPPFGPGLAPMRGPLGAVRDAVVRSVVSRAVNRPLPQLNRLRAELGLAPLTHMDQFASHAPRIVYFTAEPFEYPRRDWPPSVRLVGPVTWEPPSPPPPWLAAVERPLVLVSTSSEFQNDSRLVEVAFSALAGEDVQVIATTPAVDVGRLQPPPNARVESFLPHAPLLARAACVVCHGGMGITQKALAAGVPVCVVPFGRDQLEVARRVEVAGVGVRLPASRLREDRLLAAVRAARERRPAAQRLAAAFAHTGGATAAAAVLEELIPSGTPVATAGPRNA